MKAWPLWLVIAGVHIVIRAEAQIFLTGNTYVETFDHLAGGLPEGWGVYTNATAMSMGSPASFYPTNNSWAALTAGFKNFASANGASEGDSSTTQSKYMDRALGIRQTGAFGDPGAAFVLYLANTVNCYSFHVFADLQNLSIQSRSTLWTFDYRIGNSGPFTALHTFPDTGVFGSTTVNFTLGPLIDNINDAVFLRFAALSPSTGSGTRDSFAIDNVMLTYTYVPEPREVMLVTGLGLFGLALGRRTLTRSLSRSP